MIHAQETISSSLAHEHPKKAADDIHPGDLVYVEFDGDLWHLGRVLGCCSSSELEVEFHDGEVATVDFAAERHCMASRHRHLYSIVQF